VGSVVPFAGTAIGAVVGAGVGVALSASVEMAMLMAEEKLTRDDMKMDLLLAFKETLDDYRKEIRCSSSVGSAVTSK